MSHWKIREYSAADIPALKRLWTDSFSDSPAFTDVFFSCLPNMGSGLVALTEAEIMGAAYVIDALSLCRPGEKPLKAGYIYGVSVAGSHRGAGVGARLVQSAVELAKDRGADIVSTLPAEESLYGWYERVTGMKHRLYRKKSLAAAAAGERPVKLSAREALILRESLLSDRAHVSLTLPAMGFQQLLMEECGGGFFSLMGGLAAAYTDGGQTLVRELILPREEDAPTAAAGIAHALNTGSALYFSAAAEGESYILSDRALPRDTVWNLSFD